MSKSIAMKALSVLMALAMALYCDLPVQMAYAAQSGGAQAPATAQSASADSGSSASAGQAAGTSSASTGATKSTSADSQAASSATGDSGASASAKTQSTSTSSGAAAVTPQDDTAAAPTIGTQPTAGKYYINTTAAALSVAATSADAGALSYQWYSNTASSTDGATAIAGATSDSYRPSTAAAGTTYYYCVVTDTLGTSTASTASSIVSLAVTEGAPTWSGTGTEADPYQIGTAAQLAELATYTNDGYPTSGKFWKLGGDIALSGEWTPIGHVFYAGDSSGQWVACNYAFSGTFDGSGFMVSGLGITTAAAHFYSYGLFGEVGDATIKDLGVDGSISIETDGSVGGIVGKGSGSVTGCTSGVCIASATTTAHDVGGIAGKFSGTVSGCLNSGTISVAGNYVGGVVGYLMNGDISRCRNAAALTQKGYSQSEIAGIVSYASSSTAVSESMNVGTVYNTDGMTASGVLADAGSSVAISDCYNNGAVTAARAATTKVNDPYACGILGRNYGATATGITITNCYNAGAISKTTGVMTIHYGEIASLREFGGDHGGYAEYDLPAGTITLTNCYTASDTFAASDLGSAFKDDTAGSNGGYPLLAWESSDTAARLSGLSYSVDGATPVALTLTQLGAALGTDGATIALTGASPTAKVALTPTLADSTATVASNDGATLSGGAGTAKVTVASADGKTTRTYTVNFESTFAVTVDGSIANGSASASPANALPGDAVTVTTAPASGYATIGATATGASGASVGVTWKSLNTYTFTMPSEPVTVSATFTDSAGFLTGGETITQATIDSRGGDTVFHVSPAAAGTITVSDGLEVTFVGTGSLATDPAPDVSVQCGSGVHLTLRDIRLTTTSTTATASACDTVNFPSGDNVLTIEGEVLIERDTGATGYCAIHVPAASTLLVNGDGALYLYKSEQGAGIGSHGGNGGTAGSESSGTITFGDPITSASAGSPSLRVFAKGSKQGALVGTGAGEAATPTATGAVTFNSGTYTLEGNSRSAIVGGGAGSPAVAGGDVHVNGGSLNLNVDYTGAAIGGGGFDTGNDSFGGHVFMDGGSIRTFIDTNAVSNWTSAGVSAAGVDDAALTALKSNSSLDSDSSYTADRVALLAFDASQLKDTALTGSTSFDVSIDGKAYPVAGLHMYRYVNEDTQKAGQAQITDTRSNWVYNTSDGTASGTPSDTNLYLYAAMYGSDGATAATHTVTVNGQSFYYKYDTQTKAFAELADIAGADIAAIPDQAWTGSAVEPALDVTYGGAKLTAGTDYTVSYKDNTDSGTATAAITGIGAYAGTKTATFKIAAKSTDISGAAVAAIPDQAYTGSAITPTPEVTLGGKKLTAGTDYTVTYEDASGKAVAAPTAAGTYTLVIAGTGDYAGTVAAKSTFTIDAPTGDRITRLAGDGALDTMEAITGTGWSDKSGGTVIVATDGGYYDALTASALAGVSEGSVLLTNGGSLSPQTASELARIKPSKVVVAGGTGAVTDGVKGQIAAAAGLPDSAVSRVYGDSATDTADAIWAEAKAEGLTSDTCVIATSDGFADALSAAPAAYAKGYPIFLAGPGATLSAHTLAAIKDAGFDKAVVVGGEGVLPVEKIDDVLKAKTGVTSVSRCAGDTCFQTSTAVAEWEIGTLGMSADKLAVATADSYSDALCGAALCGRNGSILVLATPSDTSCITGVVHDNASGVARAYIFGGTGVLPDDTVKAPLAKALG